MTEREGKVNRHCLRVWEVPQTSYPPRQASAIASSVSSPDLAVGPTRVTSSALLVGASPHTPGIFRLVPSGTQVYPVRTAAEDRAPQACDLSAAAVLRAQAAASVAPPGPFTVRPGARRHKAINAGSGPAHLRSPSSSSHDLPFLDRANQPPQRLPEQLPRARGHALQPHQGGYDVWGTSHPGSPFPLPPRLPILKLGEG